MIVSASAAVDYRPDATQAMRAFTEARDAATPDELWLCEHPPVFTQGLAGKAEHVLDARRHPGRRRPTAAARSPTTGPGRWWPIR